MPNFVHPTLLIWGLPIVGVPVLIHLINLLRHRRVEWAAMEFLLASQKKNRTWVLLRQLLLLLLRMAAIAAVVLVVAEPLFHNQLGSLLGNSRTHHVVLLDDSFSMSDRWADSSAFDNAKRVIEQIGARASRQTQPQTFSLLRFSQATERTDNSPGLRETGDFSDEIVDVDFTSRLRQTLKSLEPSHVAAGPARALDAIEQELGEPNGDRRIVYLISDFRARQWENPADLRTPLAKLDDSGARLRLIDCVETARANLALTGLSPCEGTQAAGVPLLMEVTVQNFGTSTLENVPVVLEGDGNPRPAITIPQVPPGQAVKERFPASFPTAGQHVIAARLGVDAVAADNARYSVVDLPEDLPVLLIDGDPEATDAGYLSAALAPGGPVTTGINPRIEVPRYLSLNSLSPFRSIYLMNFDRLDSSAVEAVEKFLDSGGGVAVFLGERSRSKFINDALYRQGDGFFPVPVEGQAELAIDRLQKAPDLEIGQHPMFRVFQGQRNSFISTVNVRRYFAVPDDWEPKPGSTARVIARLRNGAPLAVETSFGKGRVVAMLTTAAPTWNNWARNNPSYVVAMLELQAFLSSRATEEVLNLVGDTVRLALDPSRYDPQVRFSSPDDDPTAAPPAVEAVPTSNGKLAVSLPSTERSGIHQARLLVKDGTEEVRRYAINVDGREGNLEKLTGPQLAARLEGIDYQYEQATIFQYVDEELAGFNLSLPLLYLLVVLLVVEQIVAWWASYHVPNGRRPEATGGVR